MNDTDTKFDLFGLPTEEGFVAHAVRDDSEFHASEDRALKRKVTSDTLKAIHSSASVEWYTPIEYIVAAREALGGAINLDPASCAQANETVAAESFFNSDDDGLSQPWVADRLFCNPPYGRIDGKSSQGVWGRKFLDEYRAGNFKTGILLTNCGVGDGWFIPLSETWQCQCHKRIRFVGSGSSPTKGNAFSYLGPDPERFAKAFGHLGRIVPPDQVTEYSGYSPKSATVS